MNDSLSAKPLSATASIAQQFVAARLAGRALTAYPGALPDGAQQAYAIQDAAIARWPEPVVGWKVGLVAPSLRSGFGAERLVGPVFAGLLRQHTDQPVNCPVFVGGFAAVEAEFLIRVARDAPPTQLQWSAEQAAEYVAAMQVGVEIASSPFTQINHLGPAVTASDFGNHFGLLVGKPIENWQGRDWASLRCEVSVDGQQVGTGTAASVPGGPLTAFAFALATCAQRGRPLKAGQYVCTGATTGVHEVHAGQRARAHFVDLDDIECLITPAGIYPAQP